MATDAKSGLVIGNSTVNIAGYSRIFANNPVIMSVVTTNTIPNMGGSMQYNKGISFFGPTSIRSDGTFGLPMMSGITQSYTEGNPSTPCLEIFQPTFWRFKWSVGGGNRTISVKCKQASNSVSASRPSLIVKANPSIGLTNDVSGSAPSGTGWVTIGPVSFTPTASGSVNVELWNNSNTVTQDSAFFDHIVVT
jgi:hypothetical protein